MSGDINMSVYSIVFRLLAAVVSGAVVGFERGRHGRAAGMRTHILVSTGAALSAIVGIYMTSKGIGDPSRISSGVLSGIGFIGAGMILVKGGNKITGLTTAAAIWTNAAIGIAYGAGLYAAGIAGTIVVFVTLTFMSKFEVNQKKDYLYFIEIDNVYETNRILAQIAERYPNSHSNDIMPAKSKIAEHVGITINIFEAADGDAEGVVETIMKIPGVVFVVKE